MFHAVHGALGDHFFCVCSKTHLSTFDEKQKISHESPCWSLCLPLLFSFQEESTWVSPGLLYQMQPYIESDLQPCVRVPVCETNSETEIVGYEAATFVAVPFIFYGLK